MYEFGDTEVINRYIRHFCDEEVECNSYITADRVIEIHCLHQILALADFNCLYYNCTFILGESLKRIPPEELPPIKLKFASYCTFVSFIDRVVPIEIEYYVKNYGSGSCLTSTRPVLYSGSYHYYNRIAVEHTIDMALARREVVSLAAATDAYRHAFFYNQELFAFASNTFAAGVELEIPVDYSHDLMKQLRKQWFCHTDWSQIEGNLECVSKPYALHYICSKRFEQKVRKLYKQVEAPLDRSLYSQANENSCSGIHIHISWHKRNKQLLSASLVRKNYYKLVEELGGRKYLLDKGGKSAEAFDEFSSYRARSEYSRKYDCVNVVDSTHLELRWLSNDPNPLVVSRRIKLAVDIFKAAVLLSVQQQIESTAETYLWKQFPKTLLSKHLKQPQPTVHSLVQIAEASSDLPVPAPHF